MISYMEIGQGRENVKIYLEEHKDIMNEIEKKIRDNFNKAFENALLDEMEDKDEDDQDDLDE